MNALSVPPRFDEATEKLLAGLTSLQPDLEALNHTLLVKLRYLTNGTVLSDGGASVMQQVKLFIKHQPEVRKHVVILLPTLFDISFPICSYSDAVMLSPLLKDY